MIRQVKTGLVLLLALTVLTGGIYPLVVTGAAQLVFPHQANGSLIVSEGQAVGSELIGQAFDDPSYFWGRLSATATFPYNAFNAGNLTASSGSNYGPLNPGLLAAVRSRADALRAVDSGNSAEIPVDLVTASASGLDPHISVAAALYQLPRVARERGLSEDAVRQLVLQHTAGRQFGFLGEPTVNVLMLNLALDGRL
jgi:potassium-transporting ATPase KdpC subunit